MLGIAHRPSGGILQKGLLSLRVVGLAIAAALLFAASASAAAATLPEAHLGWSPGSPGPGSSARALTGPRKDPRQASPRPRRNRRRPARGPGRILRRRAPARGPGSCPSPQPRKLAAVKDRRPLRKARNSPRCRGPSLRRQQPAKDRPPLQARKYPPQAPGSPPPQKGAEGMPAEAIGQQTPENSPSPTSIVATPAALQHAETHDEPAPWPRQQDPVARPAPRKWLPRSRARQKSRRPSTEARSRLACRRR